MLPRIRAQHSLRTLTPAIAVALLVAASTPAMAQEARRQADAGYFRPAMDTRGIFTVDRAELGQPWDWGFQFALHVGWKPINLALVGVDGGKVSSPVDYAIGFHAGFHVTFTKWMALSVDIPFARQGLGPALQSDETGGFIYNDPLSNIQRHPQAVTAGDPRVGLKFKAFTIKGFSLGFGALVTIPFGDELTFNGDKSFTLEPRIIASYQVGPVHLGANLGYLWRRQQKVYDPSPTVTDRVLLEIDDEITWGLGLTVRLTRFMGLGWEMFGRGPILSDTPDLPLETLIGLIFNFGKISWAVGGGLGIGSFLEREVNGEDLQPHGRAPQWRVFTMLTFTPTLAKAAKVVKDTDGDGIPDDKDACPGEPEDKDGFEDEDGCPDPDNDGDGIPDVKDKCPNEPEDRDGFEDEDGCPDLDNDGDGIPDAKDKCPNEPEDKDGFEDDDGCPDLDNDGDGIPDLKDKCPNEPEDMNGVEDDDGCPEGGTGQGFVGGKIDLKGEKVEFKTNSAELLADSTKLLDRVANLIRNNPQVKLIRIEGHTDDVGKADDNLRLSQARAVAVLEYLVKRGVDRARLTAVGYGQTRPLVPNTSKANRAQNRRVEFIAVQQAP
jgi:outer membrane protein OmpA-like peptidoglycan-associated protein